jgi:hypothetical protein
VAAKDYMSLQKNRELVKSIAVRVMRELEPSGTELMLGYLEPLIDLAAKNEVIVMDRWDEAGRFGNADLLGPVVVPLLVQALAEGNSKVTREDVRYAVVRVRSSQGRRRLMAIEQAINAALEGLGKIQEPGEARYAR